MKAMSSRTPQQLLDERAHQLITARVDHPAGDDDLDVRPGRELGGDVHGIGDDRDAGPRREIVASGERCGDGRGRGSARQADDHARCDERGGRQGDALLLVRALVALVADRQLVGDRVRDSPAVRAGEQTLLGERVEIATGGGGRGAEALDELVDVHLAVLGQQVEDRIQAGGALHVTILPVFTLVAPQLRRTRGRTGAASARLRLRAPRAPARGTCASRRASHRRRASSGSPG